MTNSAEPEKPNDLDPYCLQNNIRVQQEQD